MPYCGVGVRCWCCHYISLSYLYTVLTLALIVVTGLPCLCLVQLLWTNLCVCLSAPVVSPGPHSGTAGPSQHNFYGQKAGWGLLRRGRLETRRTLSTLVWVEQLLLLRLSWRDVQTGRVLSSLSPDVNVRRRVS